MSAGKEIDKIISKENTTLNMYARVRFTELTKYSLFIVRSADLFTFTGKNLFRNKDGLDPKLNTDFAKSKLDVQLIWWIDRAYVSLRLDFILVLEEGNRLSINYCRRGNHKF